MNKKSARDWVISLAPWLPSALTAHCLRRRPTGRRPNLAAAGKPNRIHPHPTTTTCAILAAPTPCPCKNQQSIHENSFFATMDVEIGSEIIERLNSEFKQLFRKLSLSCYRYCILDLGNMFQNCRKKWPWPSLWTCQSTNVTSVVYIYHNSCHVSYLHMLSQASISDLLSAYAFKKIQFLMKIQNNRIKRAPICKVTPKLPPAPKSQLWFI